MSVASLSRSPGTRPGPSTPVHAAAIAFKGCAALAAERHSFYVGGWALSSAVGFGVLALPLPLDLGVCLALIAGPLSGMALHGVALARMRPAPDAARPAA